MRLLLLHTATAEGADGPLPLGPTLLARAARKAGHDVSVVSLGAEPSATLDAALPADIVGLSLFHLDPTSLALAGELVARVANAGLPTLIGGAGFSLAPGACLRRLGADYGIAGPAERCLITLLDAFTDGRAADRAPRVEAAGLLWRDPAGAVHAPAEGAAAPTTSVTLEGTDAALPALLTGRPWCPTSGDWPPEAHHARRDVDELVDELCVRARPDRHQHRGLAGKVLWLIDPCLNEGLEWAKQLLEAIIRADLPLGFVASLEPRADTDRELIGLLRRAGCLMARCRVVSPDGSAEGGRLCGYLDDHRLPYELELVLGGPGETRGSVEGAFRWLAGCDPLKVAFELGIPILPAFEALVARARQDGVPAVTPDDQLAEPPRYVSTDVRRAWLAQRVKRYHRWHRPRVTQRWRIALQRWSLRRAARRDL